MNGFRNSIQPQTFSLLLWHYMYLSIIFYFCLILELSVSEPGRDNPSQIAPKFKNTNQEIAIHIIVQYIEFKVTFLNTCKENCETCIVNTNTSNYLSVLPWKSQRCQGSLVQLTAQSGTADCVRVTANNSIYKYNGANNACL